VKKLCWRGVAGAPSTGLPGVWPPGSQGWLDTRTDLLGMERMGKDEELRRYKKNDGEEEEKK
jgi:hypothetical protein